MFANPGAFFFCEFLDPFTKVKYSLPGFILESITVKRCNQLIVNDMPPILMGVAGGVDCIISCTC